MKKTPRSTSWFLNEVDKAMLADPSRLIRFDVNQGELSNFKHVIVSLYERGKWLATGYKHLDPVRRSEKITRWVLIPPGYSAPKPFKRVCIYSNKNHNITAKNEAWENRCKTQSRIQEEYGPEFHVQLFFEFTYDTRIPSWIYCNIWRGEDWLALQTEAFYPAEVAEFLFENIERVGLMKSPALDGWAWRDRMTAMREKKQEIEEKEEVTKKRNQQIREAYRSALRDNPLAKRVALQEDIGDRWNISGRQVRSILAGEKKIKKVRKSF